MEQMSLALAGTTANAAAAAEEVGTDEVAIIFSFLEPKDIMRARVCTTWKAAAMKTIVPSSIIVDCERSYNAMRVMSTAIPNLQRISLRRLKGRHSYSNGDEPDETWARVTANWITHDINIISRFRRLRVLHIHGPLNGRYPLLFDFSFLQELHIIDSKLLKWDLEMLSGLPQLKVLYCWNNPCMTGNLNSLRVLKDTLEEVSIQICDNVGGNFTDLADFPELKELNLLGTSVTGDIRDIRECDFPALTRLELPSSVHGGWWYEFESVAEVPGFMHAIHRLLQRTPTFFDEHNGLSRAFGWCLSQDSPDSYWYESDDGILLPPLWLKCVRAGSRFGWSWCTSDEKLSCEINWLDPEPIEGSDDYEAYTTEVQHVEQSVSHLFRGYYLSPPNAEEFRCLRENY